MHPSNWKNYFHRSTLQVQFKSGTAERPATAAQREFLAASPAGSSVGCVYGCPCHRAQDKNRPSAATNIMRSQTRSGHQARKPPTRTSDNRRRSVVLGRGGSGSRRACRCGHGRVLLLLLLGSAGRLLLLLAGTGDAGRRGLASWSAVVHGWVFERGLTSDTSPLLNFDHEATKNEGLPRMPKQ